MIKLGAVCFDFDGTLANVSYLSEFLLGQNTDYDLFHELAEQAAPIDWVVWEMKRWIHDHVIVVVTARQEKFRESTAGWMLKHEIPFDELHMRKTGDVRKDYEIKRDILNQVELQYEVKHAYDDNPNTVKLWLQRGIPTTVVPGWPEGEFL